MLGCHDTQQDTRGQWGSRVAQGSTCYSPRSLDIVGGAASPLRRMPWVVLGCPGLCLGRLGEVEAACAAARDEAAFGRVT
jgi:hypothetical protein